MLAAGLVVDDAIVVLENIQRLRGQGIASRAAAVLGTRQVFFAVVATTATLVSVFLPISFLPSTAGRLFTEFGVVSPAVTVCISSFVALTLCPMLASKLPDKAAVSKHGEIRQTGFLRGFYASALNAVLAAPLALVGACAIVGMGAYLTLLTLGEELVPKEDRGNITVFLTGPDGVGLAYTDRQVERVENILQPMVDDGTITNVFTITGRWDMNRGWIEAPLRDWSDRDVTADELIAKIDKPIPGYSRRAGTNHTPEFARTARRRRRHQVCTYGVELHKHP